MADRALTEEAVLAGLQDIRLPHTAPGGFIAEVLAAGGLGLCLAFLVATLLRHTFLSRGEAWRIGSPSDPPVAQPISGSERHLALMATLKEKRPEAFGEICARIYEPGGLPDMATLEAEVQRDD